MALRSFAILATVSISLASLALSASRSVGKPSTYDVVMSGELFDVGAAEAGFRTEDSEDACRVAITLLKLSSGGKAEIRSAYFKTTEEAGRYFDWKLEREVGKVTERTDNTSDKGEVVGKRAWVLKKDNAWELMSTNGRTFRSISANSREAVLQLNGDNAVESTSNDKQRK